MIDIFELCSSERFLAGSRTPREKSYTFPAKAPWVRQIVPASVYVRSVTKDPAVERPRTAWHVLEEGYLEPIAHLSRELVSLAYGKPADDMKRDRTALSNRLSRPERAKALAANIGQVAGVDGVRLYRESLGEMPYAHLRAALGARILFPDMTFPFLTVLLEAYEEGLLPFGVMNYTLDTSYGGPDILLCVNPLDLNAEG